MKRLFSALSLGLFLFFFFAPLTFAQSVVFSQKQVTLGNAVQFSIGPLPDETRTYRLTISDKNGTGNFFSMNIQTQKGQDCKDPTPSGPFVKGSGLNGKWCETLRDSLSNKKFHGYAVGIDTNKLNYDTRFTNYTYSLLVNNTKPSGSEFTVVNNDPPQSQFQIDLSSTSEPSANTFYENTKVDVAATGCQSGSVAFRWWRGPNSTVKACAANETGDKCDGKSGTGKSVSVDNLGRATFCKGGDCPSGEDSFGSDEGSVSSEEFIIRGVCEATGQIATSTFFVLSRDNKNDATVSVDGPVKVNTPFTVNLSQLDDGICYYYKIRSTDEHHYFQPSANGPITDCGADDDVGDPGFYLPGADNVYKASTGWAPEARSPVNATHNTTSNESNASGLPEGEYEIELFIAGTGTSRDKITTSEPFCVGEITDCGGELPPTEPPPSPCIRGVDGNGGDVDLSGDFQTLETLKAELRGLDRGSGEYKTKEEAYKEVVNGITDNQKRIEKCTEVRTGLGSIGVNPEDFIEKLMGILLSISGGIVLILIIVSGYQLIFSQGDPEKVKAARERITSAIIGLLFLIFSLVILEVIGVDILRIPGLGN